MNVSKEKYNINDLKELMARLRDKNNGCPWDIEQDFNSIKPHTIEEAYEVADAIERNDMDDLKDELGDLLFQVIFHAQMASELNAFSFDEIIHHVTAKMIFRHPHIFDKTVTKATNAADVENNIWEKQKLKERSSNNIQSAHYLDTVTKALPALSLSLKIQKKVRKVGFQYPNIHAVFDKLDEETHELKDALARNNQNDIAEEYGDFLFVAALLGRHIDVDSEEALRQANLKFMGRFNKVEDHLKLKKISLDKATIEDMTTAWIAIKGN